MGTRSGRACRTASRMSSSLNATCVSAFKPRRRQRPVGRRGEPARSIPTTTRLYPSLFRPTTKSKPCNDGPQGGDQENPVENPEDSRPAASRDRKSTRLNSSHSQISYAVFCLKKKKQKKNVYNMYI